MLNIFAIMTTAARFNTNFILPNKDALALIILWKEVPEELPDLLDGMLVSKSMTYLYRKLELLEWQYDDIKKEWTKQPIQRTLWTECFK